LLNHTDDNLQQATEVITKSRESEAARGGTSQSGLSYWGVDGDFALLFKNGEHTLLQFDELPGGITLDYFSPANSSISTINGMECSKLDYAEATQQTEQLQQAFASILETPAYEVARKLTRSMVIKKTHSDVLDELVSCTYSDLPRQINLLVSPGQVLNPGAYVDALIYESVHSLLTMVNEVEPWLPNPSSSPQVMKRIKSPWTGHPTQIQTLLHNIYGWYALYNFWMRDEWTLAYDKHYRSEKMGMIKAGFYHFDPHELFPASLNLPHTV